jgi:1-acyl-sn-glycerol-3-phosphate acyltransferase
MSSVALMNVEPRSVAFATGSRKPKEKTTSWLDDWVSHLWYEGWYWGALATFTYAFSLRTEGHDNIPRNGPALLISNHQSFLDPLAIGLAARRHLTYLARKTLFTGNKLFGRFLRSVNCVPVDQEGIATEGLRSTIQQLKAGKAVLVFPEGERSLTGQMIPLKPGIHLIIRRTHVPIIPVGVAGAYDAYPRKAKFPKFSPLFLPATRAAVAVSVGKPLDPERYASMPRQEALDELFGKVHDMVEKAERLRRKPR